MVVVEVRDGCCGGVGMVVVEVRGGSCVDRIAKFPNKQRHLNYCIV